MDKKYNKISPIYRGSKIVYLLGILLSFAFLSACTDAIPEISDSDSSKTDSPIFDDNGRNLFEFEVTDDSTVVKVSGSCHKTQVDFVWSMNQGSTWNSIPLFGDTELNCEDNSFTIDIGNKTQWPYTAFADTTQDILLKGLLKNGDFTSQSTLRVKYAPVPGIALPPNPIGQSATANSTTQITVSWSSGGGSTAAYQVGYDVAPTVPTSCATAGNFIDDLTIGNATSWPVTGLAADTQYNFIICAVNINSPVDVSSGISVSETTWELPPPDPTLPTATVLSDTQIQLDWTDGGGTTNGFKISYNVGGAAPSDCSTGGAGNVGSGSIVGTSHTIGGLTSDTLYSFRICAVNSNPTPDESVGVTVMDTTLQAVPPDPISVNGTTISTAQIDVSWASGGGSTNGYRVAYQTGGSPANCTTGSTSGDLGAAVFNYNATGLSDNTQYFFRVCAINGNGIPDESSGVTFSDTTYKLPPPDPTTQIGSVISDTQIDLSWASGGGTTDDYRISYQVGATAPSNCGTGTTIGELSISGTSHSVNSLTGGTQYSFRICAINDNPTPDESIGVTVTETTLQAPPPNPTSPISTPDSDTEITLDWTSGGGSTVDYQISYQVGATAPANCASGTTISELSISGISHQVTGLSFGTQYSFRICAINGNGTPDVSSGVTITETTLSSYCVGGKLVDSPYANSSSGGDGAGTPYTICTPTQLVALAANSGDWGLTFDLEDHLDMDGFSLSQPIGNIGTEFTGTFNGNEYTIRNLRIDIPAQNDLGLFGRTNGATLNKFKIANGTIIGSSRVGGIVGNARNGTVVSEVAFTGSVTAGGDYAGGIAGENQNSILRDCYSHSYVKADGDSGGIVGYNSNSGGGGLVSRCYSNSVIRTNILVSDEYAGGLAGYSWASNINNSFSIGNVRGNHTDATRVGRFVGFRGGSDTWTNNYYGQHDPCINANPHPCNSVANTTAVDLRATPNYFRVTTNPPLSSWDFVSIWQVPAKGPPIFAWEPDVSFGRFGNASDGDVTIGGSVITTDQSYLNGNGETRRFSKMLKATGFLYSSGELQFNFNNSYVTQTEYQVGDEIMWIITGAGATSSCTGHEGKLGFGFVPNGGLDTPSGLYLKIDNKMSADGSFDFSTLNTSHFNLPDSNSNFCRVDVLRVPNFHNLEMSGPTVMSPAYYTDHASYDGGGAIVMRVRGNFLTTSALTFDLNGDGYQGPVAASQLQGTSYTGNGSNSTSNFASGGGGANALGAGGGGNGGTGGDGNINAGSGGDYTPGCTGATCDINRILPGGSGGAANSSGSHGGDGGGLGYFSILRIKSGSSSITIDAMGENGGDSAGIGWAGGGGAGGTVLLNLVENNASAINVNVGGGDGGFGTVSGRNGGGGGGGVAYVKECTAPSASVDASAGISPVSGNSGDDGQIGFIDQPSLGVPTFCP